MFLTGRTVFLTGLFVKVWESEVHDGQFGFMSGKETTDAVFTVTQMRKKYRINVVRTAYILCSVFI